MLYLRLLGVVVVAVALSACRGDSGLEFKSPQVIVEALPADAPLVLSEDGAEDPYRVRVQMGQNEILSFVEDDSQEFNKIVDKKSYTLSLEGYENCSFWGKHHPNNDQRTTSVSSSNAGDSFLVRCDINEDGDPITDI